MFKLFHPAFYNGYNYLSMLGLDLIHFSKGAQGSLNVPDTPQELYG